MKKAFVAVLGIAGLAIVGVFGMLACQQADTVAPVISSITMEATGTGPSYYGPDSIKGTVLVSIEATDNVGIDKVIFFVNDMDSIGVGEPLTQPDSATGTYQYLWQTNNLMDSVRYSICARAYDAAGNVAKSDLITRLVRIWNTPPDTPYIYSPKDGDSLKNAYVTLLWLGEDPDTIGDQTKNLTYDIYLDTNGNSSTHLFKVNSDPIPQRSDSISWGSGQLEKFYLHPETEYYWKIIAYDEYGRSTSTKLLKFKRAANQFPSAGKAATPSDTGVIYRPAGDSLQLRWTLGDDDDDLVKYDIYFQADPGGDLKVSDLTKIKTDFEGTSLWVKLSSDTAYVWKAVGRDMWGLSRDPSTLVPWTFKVRTSK